MDSRGKRGCGGNDIAFVGATAAAEKIGDELASELLASGGLGRFALEEACFQDLRDHGWSTTPEAAIFPSRSYGFENRRSVTASITMLPGPVSNPMT